jgi:hypothetical protein
VIKFKLGSSSCGYDLTDHEWAAIADAEQAQALANDRRP